MAKAPLYPLMFHPRFKERVWGGRRLETVYGKTLPPDVPIGESWEISDRHGDESVIANGPLAGRTLRDLMIERASDILGDAAPAADGRFPLLCKILDARQKLSLQVHPPDRVGDLGEPKTEMWYIADAGPGAELFVGLKRGVTRGSFEEALAAGRVAECFHRIDVKRGDAMFLPSGRVHAIGAGLVIFEIQQNSDTTFRVHDWGRVGLDGKPRELHIAQSLESIDFGDVEPPLVPASSRQLDGFTVSSLVEHPLFNVDLARATTAGEWHPRPSAAQVVACVDGSMTARGGGVSARLRAGDFCLLPATVYETVVEASPGAGFLMARAGG
jgi:mannose-6-phosphate isomerase